MEDPREIVSEDELTGDENEALINLQKEYDIKKQQLLENQSKSKFHQDINRQVKKIDYSKRIFTFELPESDTKEVDEIEPVSGQQIRLRNYNTQIVAKLLHDIKIMNINKILAKIIKPDYKEPNYDNWSFIGYIVEKSPILKTKKQENFLKIRVGNFQHSISINLFGDGYKKYWKLAIGELIVVLNPNIHKTPKGFDFFITEDLNNILVIGTIRNIGQCSDKQCNKYINPKDKYCEFHESKQEKKFLKNKRMELNGSVKLFNPLQKQLEYLKELNEESKIFGMNSNFNLEKYINENIFKRQGSKRKLQDEKINQKLEDKLLTLGDRSKYESLGLIKKSKTTKLGNNINDNNLNNNNKDGKLLKNQFKSLTKDKKINLGMSKKDKLEKKQKWDKTLSAFNNKQKKPENSLANSDDELNIIVNKSNYDLMKSYERYKTNCSSNNL